MSLSVKSGAAMFYVFNDDAVLSGAMGIASGLGVGALSHSTEVGLVAGGAAAAPVDLATRFKRVANLEALIAPSAGGHVWFLPIWLFGVITLGTGVAQWAGWLR